MNKSEKTPHLENHRDLSSHSGTPDLQPLIVSWKHPTIRLWNSNSVNFCIQFSLYLKFLKKKKEKITNAISPKPKEFEQSHLDARFSTSDFTLTAPHYRVDKLMFAQIFLYLRLKKRTWENHKKRHISKTKRIWAVIVGLQICKFWMHPDSTHYRVEKLEFG